MDVTVKYFTICGLWSLSPIHLAALVDHMIAFFVEVAAICMSSRDNLDAKAPNAILLSLLDSLHAVLKYVSDVVRKALQAKRGGGGVSDAEVAENLLLANKPFTDLMSLLTQLVRREVVCYRGIDCKRERQRELGIAPELVGWVLIILSPLLGICLYLAPVYSSSI